MKVLIVVLISLLCAGCGDLPPESNIRVKDRCVRGVVYYTTSYHFAPAFKADGTLYTCSIE